jgi:hypothetical protein
MNPWPQADDVLVDGALYRLVSGEVVRAGYDALEPQEEASGWFLVGQGAYYAVHLDGSLSAVVQFRPDGAALAFTLDRRPTDFVVADLQEIPR